MNAVFVLIVAMLITMGLIPPVTKLGKRLLLVDIPDTRKVHEKPVPRVGGIAMIAGFLVSCAAFLPNNPGNASILAGSIIILIFGVWDDRKSLNYRIKFLGQIMAISVVIFYGHIGIQFVPFRLAEPLPTGVCIALTYFSLLGITNAVNLADGLDGLAGGTTFITVAGVCLLAYLSGDVDVFIMAGAILGTIIGFLRYNTHPAQVFMGDSGSQFLGFSAGVLVILVTQNSNSALSPSLAFPLLGIPLLDTLVVMTQRVRAGRSPFSPDRNHLHHKLLALGFDHYEAVVLIYFAQVLLVVGSVYLRYFPDAWNIAFYLVFSAVVLVAFKVMAGRKVTKIAFGGARQGRKLGDFVRRIKAQGNLTKYPVWIISTLVPAYLALAAFKAGRFPPDIQFISLVILALSILLFLAREPQKKITVYERLSAGTLIATIVYFHVVTGAGSLGSKFLEDAIFATLALCVLAAFKFSENQAFRVTSMDVLVLFAVFVIPNIPHLGIQTGIVSEVASKSIVLYYSLECLVLNATKYVSLFRLATATIALIVAIGGFGW